MTLETAKTLTQHSYIHHIVLTNADGTLMRARITSIKTWKTRPDEIEIHFKRGLYDYGTLTVPDLPNFEPGYGDQEVTPS